VIRLNKISKSSDKAHIGHAKGFATKEQGGNIYECKHEWCNGDLWRVQ